jgi:branched-chain amino acid transport system substrate-binding protein
VVGFGLSQSIVPSLRVATELTAGDSLGVIFDVVDDDVDTEFTEGAVRRALELVGTPGIAAVVGHAGSRGTLASAPIYQEAGIPLLSPSATSDALDSLEAAVYRMVPGNREQGRFLAEYAAEELGARRGLVFYVADEYGTSLSQAIASSFEGLGGTILDQVPLVEYTDVDVGPLVQQALLRGTPDVLFLAIRSNEAAQVIPAVYSGAGAIPILSGDGAIEEARIRTAVPPEAWAVFHRVRFWHASVDTPETREFVATYRRLNGAEPSDASAMQFQALMLALAGIREEGPRPQDIQRYLESLGREREPFPGLLGPLDFTQGAAGSFVLVNARTDSIVARHGG